MLPVLAVLSMSAFATLAFIGTLWSGFGIFDALKAWGVLGLLGLSPAAYHALTANKTASDYEPYL